MNLKKDVYIRFGKKVKSAIAKIISTDGRVIFEQNLKDNRIFHLYIPENTAKGVYFITIKDKTFNNTTSKKLIVW